MRAREIREGLRRLLILALVLFLGAKLPSLARSLGEARREFEKGARGDAPADNDEARD